IVGLIAGTGVAVKAVADIIGDMTGLAKCGFGIVFNDEDAHGRHIAHPYAKQQAGSCLPPCRLRSRHRNGGARYRPVKPRGREAQEAGLTSIATKWVPSLPLTRKRTALRLSFLASASTALMSAGWFTARPPASRMTSPICRPFCAAKPSGSMSEMTTPWLPAPSTLEAGASASPRPLNALLSRLMPGFTRASLSSGREPSFTDAVFSAPSCQ